MIRVGLTPAKEVQAQDNTLVLFFFSGHGLQVGEKDYLIPRLPGRGDLKAEDVESLAVSLSSLLQTLERAAAASVVILDTHFPTVSMSPTR
jgi:uncharacterized caspase-like protein